MTAVDMTPHWPAAEEWAGFLLVVVPVGRVSEFSDDMRRRVRAEIETDPVLYDLVTVTIAPPFAPTPGWDRAFLECVIGAAMPDGHFFAPRGTLGAVVVGGLRRKVDEAVEDLGRFSAVAQMGMRLFPVAAQGDPDNGVAQATVREIAATVINLIGMFDADPEIALSEREFLHRVGTVIEENDLPVRVVRPPLAKPRPAPPALDRAPAGALTVPPQRELPVGPVNGQMPVHFPNESVVASEPAVAARTPTPISRPTDQRMKPVIYDGAEIVNVDQRTTMQRLTRKNPTDADTIHELRDGGRAVGLVQLVFVPDDGVVSRTAAKRRASIALELDQALASVRFDALSGEPAQVAVEVFAATDPVRRHGVLRVAGKLTEAALPRVDIEYFSLSQTVDPLLDAARRTARALGARGIDVVSTHVVFLAAMRFPADDTTVDDWARLLEHARVTWVDFGPPGRWHEVPELPESPFGLHVLSDKEDVVALIRKESEAIYGYAPQDLPVAAPAVAPPAPAAVPEAEPEQRQPRRWWRRRKLANG
jgi:hypothetical protein